jgi:hypothetical protein
VGEALTLRPALKLPHLWPVRYQKRAGRLMLVNVIQTALGSRGRGQLG